MRASTNRLTAFDDLEKMIINNGFCTLCGACEAACPIHAIRVESDKPRRLYNCAEYLDSCPICYNICPHTEALIHEAASFLLDTPYRRESIGGYRRIVLARSSNPTLRKATKGGGVVSALLNFAMDRGIIDSAVISEATLSTPIKVKPAIRLVPDDVLSAVEIKVVPSAVAEAYGRAVFEYGKSHVAFVGTPCHVLALRELEAWQHKVASSLKLIIGLFCLWSFSLGSLLEYLFQERGITPGSIKHVDLSPDYYILSLESGEARIPLSEVKGHIMNRCRTCADFTSEFADLSVGGATPLEGWSTVIVRTGRGESIFNEAVKEGAIEVRRMEPEVFAHIVQLASYKQDSAFKEIRELSRKGLPVPGAMKISEKLVSGGVNELRDMKVGEIMTRNVISLNGNLTVSEFLDEIVEHHHIGYPVIDDANKLIGIVTLQDAMKVPKEKRGSIQIKEICSKDLVTVFPDDSVADALEKMGAHNIGRLLVVDRKDKSILLGIVTRSDILREITKLYHSGKSE
ncbi:MAG: Coenzyme F420 hydrogenase/dehydrogenase, beta subunit C-terminal domain [Candidatus Bathyarchaeia archaeon]